MIHYVRKDGTPILASFLDAPKFTLWNPNDLTYVESPKTTFACYSLNYIPSLTNSKFLENNIEILSSIDYSSINFFDANNMNILNFIDDAFEIVWRAKCFRCH